MRLASSTSTDDDSVISQQISVLWKSRGSRHSSRPSKMNTILTSSSSILLISFSCGKVCCSSSMRLNSLSFFRFRSRKGE
uniref:Uncharacterized protein n=1 Tax=Anguilla anguilla TaxID=7936 RepID=A0A0E9TIY7_ANGAN